MSSHKLFNHIFVVSNTTFSKGLLVFQFPFIKLLNLIDSSTRFFLFINASSLNSLYLIIQLLIMPFDVSYFLATSFDDVPSKTWFINFNFSSFNQYLFGSFLNLDFFTSKIYYNKNADVFFGVYIYLTSSHIKLVFLRFKNFDVINNKNKRKAFKLEIE